jgi:hypothetical protein
LKKIGRDALNTAIFVGKINDIFDCLNSRVSCDRNPLRCAISDNNPQVYNYLSAAINWISQLSVIPKSGKITAKSKKSKLPKNPTCFAGLIISIKSTLALGMI